MAIVTQTSFDMIITGPTGTTTSTIEVTTPSIEELAIDPMDRDMKVQYFTLDSDPCFVSLVHIS